MAESTETAAEDREYSETDIAVHWREEKYVEAPQRFKAQANANDGAILERFAPENSRSALRSTPSCSRRTKMGRNRRHEQPAVLQVVGRGRLDACVNYVDRHLESRGDENAIVSVPELEEDGTEEITYRDLHRRVNDCGAAQGLLWRTAGDWVTFHCRWCRSCRLRCSRAPGSE